jgi:VCBS repeat-containing protein
VHDLEPDRRPGGSGQPGPDAGRSRGFITGLRFYKGTLNTGPHRAHLWTNSGTLLAQAPFTSETANGWQEVSFPSPVAIAANTTYVASYHTVSGNYAITRPYFTTSKVTPPLEALADGLDGANGVFKYAAAPGAFPDQTFGATNYWVDVKFVTSLGNQAPSAINDSYSVSENGILNVSAPGVLGNDSDPDPGTTLTAILVAPPQHGSLALNPNGSFTYTPATNYDGPDSFTYRASDGSLQSAVATVNITVTPINNPPVVNAGPDQSITLPGTASLTGSVTDDGPFTSVWGKVSGPGTVAFGNPNAPVTTATFSLPGTYELSLTASDGQFVASDSVIVTAIPANAGVRLDGVNDYVTFGAAAGTAELGATTFTLETWIRREGPGVPAGTGTGGLTNALPIITKGAAQADGSNLDANYFLGMDANTRVLVADFEDAATGANHPVVGVTPIADNIWYHVAATYDGTTWRLYLNGVLDRQLVVGAFTPRSDSIQHAGLGTTLTSTGVAAGFFNGSFDESRIWNVARSAADIQATMGGPIATPAANLIGRWALNESTGTPIRRAATTTAPSSTAWCGTAARRSSTRRSRPATPPRSSPAPPTTR